MDLYSLIASGLEEYLKCFVCKNYLSYFPISVCSNNRSICGRCILPEGISGFHDEAFETVSQSLKFPCCYQSEGCSETLEPKYVPQHEENCALRIVRCILEEQKSCKWSGSLPILYDHCHNEHKDAFLKNGQFQINLTKSADSQHLVEFENKLFFFMEKFDPERKILTCAMYANQYDHNIKNYECRLSVTKGKTRISHEFGTTSFEGKTYSEVHLQFVRKESEQQEIASAKISLSTGEIVTKIQELEREETILRIRDILRCSVCRNYIRPSILCTTSFHLVAICSTCGYTYLKVDHCDKCKRSTNIKDKIMNMVVPLLTYPCKFLNKGCTYLSNFEEVQTHQTFCPRRPDVCPFSGTRCPWMGFRERTESHLLVNHSSRFYILGTEIQICSHQREDLRKKLIRFCDCLFLLFYKVENETFKCTVQKVGICRQRFGYEVEVFDAIEPGGSRRHLTIQSCGQFTELKDVFPEDSSAHSSVFKKEQIFPNSGENALTTTFKVRVFRSS